jgi:DNA (cytosine-5)-methyltransferase 1
MNVCGLFAGIGGFEAGLSRAGHHTSLLCEADTHALAVLEARFQGVPVAHDVRTLKRLPSETEVLTAGFPCQDLSQAGATAGIHGKRSGLVGEVFRLLRVSRPPLVILENVSFMLRLKRGSAMALITHELEALGYEWAYRVVDSRSFGVPQRRKRVFVVAALSLEPSLVVLSDDVGEAPEGPFPGDCACGFYWTEGNTGLGWAVDAIPTLKGGSAIGIPSPPAVWIPGSGFFTPDIRDAERLQGFKADWTKPAEAAGPARHRWKLVGNAVTIPVTTWLGKRLKQPGRSIAAAVAQFAPENGWPDAAFSRNGKRYAAGVSHFPESRRWPPLRSFLKYPMAPLSARAADGFRRRLFASELSYLPDFGRELAGYVPPARMVTTQR